MWIERLDNYLGINWKYWKGFITSYYFQWYSVIYFWKTLKVRIILYCCFGFGKNSRSVAKKDPPPPACSQLSLTFSRPLVTNFPQKLTVGSGLFGVMKWILKFTSIIMHRNTYCKGKRTQLKIWFFFCQSPLCLFKPGKVHFGLGFSKLSPVWQLCFIEISRASRDSKEHITSQSFSKVQQYLQRQYIVEGRGFNRSKQPANFAS